MPQVARKTAAKSALPAFTQETADNLLRTATRRIASGAELWFEKLQGGDRGAIPERGRLAGNDAVPNASGRAVLAAQNSAYVVGNG
jgi:hypothetical protein